MKGRSSPLTGAGPTSKWTAVSKTLRDKKIGLLAVQETHLSDQLADEVSNLHQRRITIINSPSETNPTNSAGVAFVINKEVLNAVEVKQHTLIPGRAIFISFRWHNDITMSAINVYAPNDISKHPQFWEELREIQTNLNLPNPDLLLGDFNLTEDTIDRAPARPDNENATRALRNYRYSLGMRDAWRMRFPLKRTFTFTSHGHSMSRIDRIYTKEELEDNISDWTHETPGIPSDHKMVSIRVTHTNAPFIGNDRWSWPLGLIHDKELNKYIKTRGQRMHQEMNNLRPEDRSQNPQTLWQDFKNDIKNEAIKAAKKQIPKMTERIKALERDLDRTYQREDLDTSHPSRHNAAHIEREIEHLERKKYRKTYTKSQAMWHLKGEKINKYWMKVNNPRKPRDMIRRLIDPQTQKPLTRSDEMAKTARNYHENLQSDDLLPETDQRHEETIHEALNSIPDAQKLKDPTSSPLSTDITHDDLSNALRGVKLGTAAGPDGIPYELWKHLNSNHKANLKNNKPTFDVLNCMLNALTDIQRNGVDQRTNFTRGTMCPIYKKKEKDQIKNYRPITLLNTDYKLLIISKPALLFK